MADLVSPLQNLQECGRRCWQEIVPGRLEQGCRCPRQCYQELPAAQEGDSGEEAPWQEGRKVRGIKGSEMSWGSLRDWGLRRGL